MWFLRRPKKPDIDGLAIWTYSLDCLMAPRPKQQHVYGPKGFFAKRRRKLGSA